MGDVKSKTFIDANTLILLYIGLTTFAGQNFFGTNTARKITATTTGSSDGGSDHHDSWN